VAVASVGVQVRVEVGGNAQADVAVAGADGPLGADLRAVFDFGVDVAVAGFEAERIKAAADGDVAVAGIHIERAIEVAALDVTVAGMKAKVAVEAVGVNVAVARINDGAAGDVLGGDVAVAGADVEIGFARLLGFEDEG